MAKKVKPHLFGKRPDEQYRVKQTLPQQRHTAMQKAAENIIKNLNKVLSNS